MCTHRCGRRSRLANEASHCMHIYGEGINNAGLCQPRRARPCKIIGGDNNKMLGSCSQGSWKHSSCVVAQQGKANTCNI